MALSRASTRLVSSRREVIDTVTAVTERLVGVADSGNAVQITVALENATGRQIGAESYVVDGDAYAALTAADDFTTLDLWAAVDALRAAQAG